MRRPSFDYEQASRQRLIRQVAGYYNETKESLAFYQSLGSPALVKLTSEHLNQWKRELRRLILGDKNQRSV